jgi:hypothetical protein
LCRSCMPPGHQLAWLLQSLAWLLYLNCNNIVVHSSLIIMLLLKLLYLILSLIFFCFIMKNSTPPAPPLARAQPRKPGFLKIAPPLHPLWPELGGVRNHPSPPVNPSLYWLCLIQMLYFLQNSLP